eukprot:4504548-Ditylum_brightwellii.AAC.1
MFTKTKGTWIIESTKENAAEAIGKAKKPLQEQTMIFLVDQQEITTNRSLLQPPGDTWSRGHPNIPVNTTTQREDVKNRLKDMQKQYTELTMVL